MKYNARKLYETYYQTIIDAEKNPAVVKGENADGKTYILEKGEDAFVAGKNNEYIILIGRDGSWTRAGANGEVDIMRTDGSWVTVKPDGERISVKANGTTNITYHQGDVPDDIITSLKTPKVPAQVEGFASIPPKTCKGEEARYDRRYEVKSLERLGPCASISDVCGPIFNICLRVSTWDGVTSLRQVAHGRLQTQDRVSEEPHNSQQQGI